MGPLSPLASQYKVHLTEWRPLLTRLGIRRGTLLPAEPAGTPSPFPTLYRKLSPAPDTFLLLSRASDLHWTFLSWPELRCYYLAFPSVLEVFSFLVKGSRTSPQMFCSMSESPSGKREGFQGNATRKKGKFITDASPGSCRIQRSGAVSESPEPQLLHQFIG